MDSPQAVAQGAKFKKENADAAAAIKKARQKRVYEHEMNSGEKVALQACLKAKNALTAIAEHIQEGKGCKQEVLKLALAIQSAAVEVLFVE